MLTLKLLFVCSGNIDRSPTAADIFREMEGVEARSAGILESAPNNLSKELIDWADHIFAMEEMHKRVVVELSPKAEKKTRILDIPDVYLAKDPRLARILRAKLSIYFPDLIP